MAETQTAPRQDRQSGLKLARIAGITVILDWSLLIIAFLIAASVAMGPLTQWHDWGMALRWLVGIGAAVLLFFSVLVHEFSHALVARRYGTPVERITLFIFGGMAHMEQEPRDWKAETLIAGVGPVTSLVLGALFLFVAGFFVDAAALQQDSAQAIFGSLSPLATLLFWAGNVNIILAVFNLVPAFPLDGGRVLRALLWGWTGHYVDATRYAASGGRFFGWLLIATGILMVLGIQIPFFGTGLVGGLWLIFIGWFLSRIAMLSYQEAGLKESLARVKVNEIMRRNFASLDPGCDLERLVDDYLLPRGQRGYPVLERNELVGLVSFDDVRRVARSRWPETRVRDVMTPRSRLFTLDVEEDSFQALSRLSNSAVNQMPVMDGDRVIGMLQREDILRWLQLYRPNDVGAGLMQNR